MHCNNKTSIVLFGAVCLAVTCFSVHAALFTVLNTGTKSIVFEQTWNSEDLEAEIKPKERMRFNTGFANVTKIRWQVPHINKDQTRTFEVPVHVGFLNLGGMVAISDDGAYKYYFGIDGSSEGIAK